MKQFTIEVDDETAARLEELATLCSATDTDRNGATSHGQLTVPRLLRMLAQDAAMTLTRPGSWEGANMARVLSGHGYEF